MSGHRSVRRIFAGRVSGQRSIRRIFAGRVSDQRSIRRIFGMREFAEPSDCNYLRESSVSEGLKKNRVSAVIFPARSFGDAQTTPTRSLPVPSQKTAAPKRQCVSIHSNSWRRLWFRSFDFKFHLPFLDRAENLISMPSYNFPLPGSCLCTRSLDSISAPESLDSIPAPESLVSISGSFLKTILFTTLCFQKFTQNIV